MANSMKLRVWFEGGFFKEFVMPKTDINSTLADVREAYSNEIVNYQICY